MSRPTEITLTVTLIAAMEPSVIYQKALEQLDKIPDIAIVYSDAQSIDGNVELP